MNENRIDDLLGENKGSYHQKCHDKETKPI